MNNDEPISTPQSRALIDSWDRQLEALNKKLRDSGCTVTVVEPSDTNEFTVTFPSRRRYSARPIKDAENAANPPGKPPKVCIGVEWGYELHTIELSAKRWSEIKNGAERTVMSKGWYEGTSFDVCWQFNCSQTGALVVTYGEDGADGFIGSIADAMVSEVAVK